MSSKIKVLGIILGLALIIGIPWIVVTGSKTMIAYISGYFVGCVISGLIEAMREDT